MGFENFERLGDVEDGLGAGAHHRHLRASQFLEVGGNVEALLGAAMHPADPAGGEDLDAGHGGDHHRRADGRAGHAAAAQGYGEVAPRRLGSGKALARQPFERGLVDAGHHLPVHDGDGRRHGAVLADQLFDAAGHLEVLRIGHAMGDDGGFERHHRLAVVEGLAHMRPECQSIGYHSCLPFILPFRVAY